MPVPPGFEDISFRVQKKEGKKTNNIWRIFCFEDRCFCDEDGWFCDGW